MGRKSGPKSMTELMIDGSTTVVQRPDAPYNLTDEESDEWRAIVNSMPAEHFARIHYPMLTQLCRHKVQSDRVAQLIESICKQKKLDTEAYKNLCSMQAVESSAIIRLCRSMRLTHQSLYRAESVKPRPVALTKNPWDPDE